MALPSPVPVELAELIARRFRAIGDPMRVRILDRLRDGELTVNDLADALDTSQQNVSKHLALLAESGILARRKEGTRVHYRVVDSGVYELCEQVCGSLHSRLATLAALTGGLTTEKE